MELAIHTEYLTKIYSQRLIAVNDINLEVPQGSVFGLLGPNGAGKTTTLRLLLGLQRPTAGRAEVFSKSCGPNAVSARSQIGYLPTNLKLPGSISHCAKNRSFLNYAFVRISACSINYKTNDTLDPSLQRVRRTKNPSRRTFSIDHNHFCL